MKDVWKVHGMIFRSNMCWYALMLQKSVTWRLLKRNHNLFRQSFFGFYFILTSFKLSTGTLFLQVIPTFLYRKPRLDVTCLVLYIERSERPSFRRRVLKPFYKLIFNQLNFSFFLQADYHAKYNGQKSECMEESARIIAKAFGNCMTDRCSPFQHAVYFLNPRRILKIGRHHLTNLGNGEFIMSLV